MTTTKTDGDLGRLTFNNFGGRWKFITELEQKDQKG